MSLSKVVKDSLAGADFLRVGCVGGGPGSDALGVLQFLSNAGIRPKKVAFTFVDYCQEWALSWQSIWDQLPGSVNSTYMKLDVTSTEVHPRCLTCQADSCEC